jgi:hypothetical protein
MKTRFPFKRPACANSLSRFTLKENSGMRVGNLGKLADLSGLPHSKSSGLLNPKARPKKVLHLLYNKGLDVFMALGPKSRRLNTSINPIY